MREIKFRAWDVMDKEMKLPTLLHLSRKSVKKDDNGGVVHTINCNGQDNIFIHNGGFVLMQFTGLYDKHGKEIYEGDVLATSNNNHTHDLWAKEEYGYTNVYWDNVNSCWRGSEWTWENTDESVYGLCFIEVIGNLYQNPELIHQP